MRAASGVKTGSVLADFSRTCEGCEHIRATPWPVKGSYRKETVAYRCFAPGPRKGYHMGTIHLFPYIPAWCPKLEKGAAYYGAEKDVSGRI